MLQPIEVGSLVAHRGPGERLNFRFEVAKRTGAFRSMQPTLVVARASGAMTELPLPEAGASAERDGILVFVDAVTESGNGGAVRRRLRRALWRAHALGIRVLMPLGAVAAVVLLLPPWRGRMADPAVEALGLIAAVVVARVAMLTAIDSSSFPAWSSRYVYPIVSLTSCGLFLLVFAAVRHRTHRRQQRSGVDTQLGGDEKAPIRKATSPR